MTEPSPDSPAGTGVPPANLEELTQQVIKDTASAVPRPTDAAAPAAGGLDITDASGRPFDPALHVVRKDGTPARHPHTGRLYCLPGMSGKPMRRRAAAPVADGGAFMELEAPPSGPMHVEVLGGTAPSGPLPFDPVYNHDDAVSGAELITDFTELVARYLAGDDAKPTADEESTRRARWSRWMEANQLSVPFARFGQAVFGEGKYLARVYNMPAAQEKIAGLIRWWKGQPDPPKAKVADAPKAAPSGPAAAPTPLNVPKPLVELGKQLTDF